MNLYGEDLNSVLLRFRKSPEYLSILQDKADAIKEQLEEMTVFAQAHTLTEMRKTVYSELFNSTGDETNLRSRLTDNAFMSSILRQKTSSTVSPILMLDTYKYLHKGMLAADVNYFKDIGFEYAGQTIHKLIHHMDPKSTMEMSTKQFQDDNSDSVKKHEKKHLVTITPSDQATNSIQTKYHFRNKSIRKSKKTGHVSNRTTA